MEELKLMVEAISSLSAAGKDAFISYLLASWVLPYSVLIFFLCLAYKMVFKIMNYFSYLSKLTRAAGFRGYLEMSRKDCEELLKRVGNIHV